MRKFSELDCKTEHITTEILLTYNNGYGGMVVLWLMCSGSSSLGSSPDWGH